MALQRKHKQSSLQNSDPGKILDLVMSLNDETCAQLQLKINSYLADVCEAELVVQVIVHGDRMEASIDSVGNTPLSKKTKIVMTKKMIDTLKGTIEQVSHLSDFAQDFKDIVTTFLENKDITKTRVVLYPIVDRPFSVIVCVIGSKMVEETVGALSYECFLFVWPTLKKCIAYEHECTLKQKCQQLLRVARRLFSQVASLDILLQIAMEQAKMLTKAAYCTVMLVDPDQMQLVDTSTSNKEGKEPQERRFPMDIGIAGRVMRTGTIFNVKDINDVSEYNGIIDGYPNVDTKTLLCFPIREQTGIIGVGQLINKVGEPYFDMLDEETALAFSIYCGVCIIHSVVYQKIQEAHIRNVLCNELVMYHMKISDSEIARLVQCTGYHNHPHVTSLHFNPRALPLKELPCYVIRMFTDLGLDKKFKIRPAKLATFVLYVKKGYRDVPYHSWHHSFNVAQWAYAALTNYKLVASGYYTELQGLMYLVAALTHDLDHRGTTNSFQIQGQTTLAALYSSEGSVMERHHLSQAMTILNTEGCDILESLSRKDYDRAIMTLRDYILATDLANYFKNLREYQNIAEDFQKGNRLHLTALHALMMNAADLSDQLKDWGSIKKTAASVLTEFFKQGDVEKSRGDLPVLMMDRDKCFIPELEIQFLSTTCIPLFEILGKIIPKAAPCVKILENHMERWDAAKPIFNEVPVSAGLAVLLSPELDNLIEINLNEKEQLRMEAEAAEVEGK